MSKDGMNHTLHAYNQDLAIFKEALLAEGTATAMFALDRIEARGAGKMMLSDYDLKLIYNGMALLELGGVEHRHSDEQALLQREGKTHPWGNDPVGRFRNWQKWILERL